MFVLESFLFVLLQRPWRKKSFAKTRELKLMFLFVLALLFLIWFEQCSSSHCFIKCSHSLLIIYAHIDWLIDYVRKRCSAPCSVCFICWTLLQHALFFLVEMLDTTAVVPFLCLIYMIDITITHYFLCWIDTTDTTLTRSFL